MFFTALTRTLPKEEGRNQKSSLKRRPLSGVGFGDTKQGMVAN